MAYSELIKNFNRIRDYMREFYIYGFKTRDEYTRKSARSYDDEKRRIESYLGDYMMFRQTQDGKNVFLSIDSRISRNNPLYKVWKTKSFTDGDIILHFVIIDILINNKEGIEFNKLLSIIYDFIPTSNINYDESTIRKKLKEYEEEGIVRKEKKGKQVKYYLEDIISMDEYVDILNLFSEVSPCGVIGSFLLDKIEVKENNFAYKHHYITGALDSEIVCNIFLAIKEKRNITLDSISKSKDRVTENHVIPLKIYSSVQSGRQYLLAYVPRQKRIVSFRLDYIISVKLNEVSDKFDYYRETLNNMKSHMWGVSTSSWYGDRIEHVDFTITINDNEDYIINRLEREKRIGTVEYIDKHTIKFSADVYDSTELIPWIRTFICRIKEVNFSNSSIQKLFLDDIKEMNKMYGIDGGEYDI